MTETVCSAGWGDAPAAEVTVVVSSVDRADFLPGLLAALEAQEAAAEFEVVVADDGSRDGTWQVLTGLARSTSLPFAALRLPVTSGAATGRNAAVAHGRARVVAFTDDDCLPTPGWLGRLCEPFTDAGVVVVQGRTEPEPVAAPGAWARSLWVTAPTPWLETCNIAYRRSAFDSVGGFDEQHPLFNRSRSGNGFGEDTWLGRRVLAAGGARVFAAQAVVHHRWRPSTFAAHVGERRRMRDFPELVRCTPGVAATCWGGVFLSRRTAAVDLAAASVAIGLATRRPVLLLGVLPWLRTAWGPARDRRGPLLLRLAQGAVADLAGLAALAEGSVRHRRVVL